MSPCPVVLSCIFIWLASWQFTFFFLFFFWSACSFSLSLLSFLFQNHLFCSSGRPVSYSTRYNQHRYSSRITKRIASHSNDALSLQYQPHSFIIIYYIYTLHRVPLVSFSQTSQAAYHLERKGSLKILRLPSFAPGQHRLPGLCFRLSRLFNA